MAKSFCRKLPPEWRSRPVGNHETGAGDAVVPAERVLIQPGPGKAQTQRQCREDGAPSSRPQLATRWRYLVKTHQHQPCGVHARCAFTIHHEKVLIERPKS